MLKEKMIVFLLLSLLAFTGALPSGIDQETSKTNFVDIIAAAIREFNDYAEARSTVDVPTNCPSGQALVNGVCRDIWRIGPAKIAPIVKLACPAGYAAVGGECIDWSRNVVTVPNNCPEGQVWVNGACRDIWRTSEIVRPIVTLECPAGYAFVAGKCIDGLRNVVSVPDNCPEGQALVNGACHDIWRFLGANVVEKPAMRAGPRNSITVPNNCKPNQQWVDGQCRDIWRSGTPSLIVNH